MCDNLFHTVWIYPSFILLISVVVYLVYKERKRRKHNTSEPEPEPESQEEEQHKLETLFTQDTTDQIEDNSVDDDSEKQFNLLIAEDNEDLLIVMNKTLSRHYHVFVARDGEEALEIIKKEKIHLVISDIMMPKVSGLELCSYIKSDSAFITVPVILLTAKIADEDKVKGYESGADSYLTKPFSFVVLDAKVKSLLSKIGKYEARQRSQVVVKINDIEYKDNEKEFIQKATSTVQLHIDDEFFDPQHLSQEMGTSKSTLYKKLMKLTNMNPSSFISTLRIKTAQKILMENPTIRISELAYAVGFSDPKYFSKCFKKEFGMNPTEYVEANK